MKGAAARPVPLDAFARRRAKAAAAFAGLAAVLALSGCATTHLDAQWVDPQAASRASMHLAKVMVACEAYEPVVKQLCVERMSSELEARGATAIAAPQVANSTPGRPVPDDQLLAAARSAGAGVVMVTTVTASGSASGSGSGFSIGLGGFGGGSHIGGGVGVELPIGGGESRVGYQANAKLMDLTGRPAWTAMASTGASNNVSTQIDQLVRTLADAADKAGLF